MELSTNSMSIEIGAGDVDDKNALAINRLIASYFGRVDRPGSESVSELFTEAGSLILGTARVEGRVAIAEFLARREYGNRDARRTVRHMSGGLELSRLDTTRVRGQSTAIVFASVGDMPLVSGPPSTICDFDDVYVQLAGRWLFERRQATVLFIGPSAANFAK